MKVSVFLSIGGIGIGKIWESVLGIGIGDNVEFDTAIVLTRLIPSQWTRVVDISWEYSI